MNNKLLKKSTRVIIPFKNDEDNEYIEIKNPKESVIKKVKERVINRIEGKDEFSNNEILEFLINELTNVKLETSLEELLEDDISFECKMLLYHITEIFNEIQEEILFMVKMDLMDRKNKKLEEEINIEISQV